MVRFIVLLALAVTAYFAWVNFSAEADPVIRLSRLIDARIDEILGPLPLGAEGAIASPPQNHDLRILRESIRDLERKVAPKKQQLYKVAAQLCDDLLRAGDERDSHIARINDTRAKSNPSPLATDPERHRLERLAFFENGIALSWKKTSKDLRAIIDQRYRQFRDLQRNL
jgi:hypothetical protein